MKQGSCIIDLKFINVSDEWKEEIVEAFSHLLENCYNFSSEIHYINESDKKITHHNNILDGARITTQNIRYCISRDK